MVWEMECGMQQQESSVGLGRAAERIVGECLERHLGLRMLDRNWYSSHRELDLVMEDDAMLHVIEVRSLSHYKGVMPYETIGREKRRRIVRAASSYASRHNVRKEIVFDVASVLYGNGKVRIEYIPDAYQPGW